MNIANSFNSLGPVTTENFVIQEGNLAVFDLVVQNNGQPDLLIDISQPTSIQEVRGAATFNPASPSVSVRINELVDCLNGCDPPPPPSGP